MVDLERISMPSDPGGGGAPDQNARLLQMLLRGKWLILVLPVLFAGVTWAYYGSKIPGFKVIPLFRATAKIQLDSRIQDPIDGSTQPDFRPSSLAKQQEQLFKSQVVMKPLSEMDEVANLRTFQNLGGKTIMAALYEGLTARSDAKTDRVAVSFVSPSRRDAMIVADAAIVAFRKYHGAQSLAKAQRSIDALEKERDEKLKKIKELDATILAKKQEHNITFEDLRNPHTSLLEAHTLSRQQALQARHTAEVALARVEKAAEDPQAFLDYGTAQRNNATNAVFEEKIAQFVQNQGDLRADFVRKSVVYPEGSEVLAKIEEEIAALQLEIDEIKLSYAEDGLRVARDRVQEQTETYEKFDEITKEVEKDFFAMETVLTELKTLMGDRQLLQGDTNQYASRIADLTVSGAGGGLGIHTVEAAHAGQAPVYPEKQKYMLIAAVLGLGLGLGFVLLRGFADRRIWTVEEVPNLLGTDVVGVFPELFTHKRPKVGRIVEEDPGSLAAESIRSLRTSCSFGLPDNGKGIVFVTSSISGEGKSVVASNLAIAFAQSGRKTLLLDADLRSPGQNEIFAVIGKRGFGDALAGNGDYEAGLVRSITSEGLDMLPAGDASKGAAELVEGGSSREVFARLRQDYDCIVVDSSPVLETAETRILASISDLVVFVMRMNVSTAPNGQRAVGILRSVGAELLGVMLNGARTRKGAKAYAGGLTYGYGYGYGQYKKTRGRQNEMQEVASQATPSADSSRYPSVGEAKS